ncbi:MAG: hypothetical protein WBX37_25815, partial [Pseudolabrys sp.]
DEAAQRQRGHFLHVMIANMAAPAHRQHGGDSPQVNVPFLDRHHMRRIHHDPELIVGKAKHVPDNAAAVAEIKLALGINPANVTARGGRCPRLSREPLRCGGGNCAGDRHQSKNAHHPAQK